MQRLRQSIATVLTVLVSLTLGLAIVELSLRGLDIEPLRELARGKDLVLRVSEYPEIGYELTPGAEGEAFRTFVRVNSRGFRGPEPRQEPTVRRIVVLGDSIAFGSEIPEGTAFPDLLRDRLATRDPSFEVENLALSGYDTLQEVAILQHRGLALQPELVILGYCLNDAGVVSANAEYLHRVERYRASVWITHSRVLQLIATRIDRLRGRIWEREQNDPLVFRATYAQRIEPIGEHERELAEWMASAPDVHPSDWYRDAYRVGRIRHGFRDLATLAARGDFRVIVVVFPWLESPADGGYPHAAAHRIVDYEASRHGFRVLDLQAAFAAAGLERLRNDPDDPTHPSPTGHRIAAERIVAELDAAGWLSGNRQTPTPQFTGTAGSPR